MRDRILAAGAEAVGRIRGANVAGAFGPDDRRNAPGRPAANGFSVDTTGLQTGNIIHLTYTDALAVQHQISIVRVDDPSVLPLPNSTTPDRTTR